MKIHRAEFETAAETWGQLPAPTLPEVAFIGRSNVGKSSLINMVLGRKSQARTSGQPGKTRQFNFYRVDDRCYFVDLPGFGYARVSKKDRERWQVMIGRFVTERPGLRLVFHLVDGRHPPTPLDHEVMRLIRESTASYVILMTKGDKLSGNERDRNRSRVIKAAAAEGLEVPVILTSSADGRGRNEVHKWIETLTS